jgi:hypothetical protein
MYCPFLINQYGNAKSCEKNYCALWLKDQECCSIKAIATGVLSQVIMPTVQSGRVSITDISPSYETVSSVDAITSERSDFDYIYAFGGEG